MRLNAKKIKVYKKSLREELREYHGYLKRDLKDMLKMRKVVLGKDGSFDLDKLWFQHRGGNTITNNLHGGLEVSYFKSSKQLRDYIKRFFIKRGFIVSEITKEQSGLRVVLHIEIPV